MYQMTVLHYKWGHPFYLGGTDERGHSAVNELTRDTIGVEIELTRSFDYETLNLALTSSVCHSITVMETMGVAKTIVGQISRPFEVYFLILVEFCIFTYVISFICKFIDRKIHVVL